MMGEDSKTEDKRAGNEDLELKVVFELGGGIRVEGPGNGQMYDEPMCFWMLEKAKDFIKFRNNQLLKSNLYVPDRLRRRV